MWRLSAVLLCLAVPGLPQALTLGAEGGLRLTGDTPLYGTSNSRRYLVGPKIELGLPLHFALEADGLYSRLGNTYYVPLVANESFIRTIANSWQFPLLAKYYLPVLRRSLFVSAGVALRHARGRINTIHYGYLPGDVTFSSMDWHARDHGFVLGGGGAVKFGHIRIAPEVRYVHWDDPAFPSPFNTAFYLQPAHNYEAQFLLGIGWSTK